MPRFFSYDGDPLTFREWTWLFQARGPYVRWRVGLAWVGDAEVSTVWIGMAPDAYTDPPAIFATLVTGGALDGCGERYATAQQARDGHDRWVEMVELEAATVALDVEAGG